MKKRIVLSLLIVIELLTITGCGRKDEKESALNYFKATEYKVKSVKVPDVSNLSVDKAIDKIMESGFKVTAETIKESSSTIKKGNVIKTSPAAGESVRQGSTITIYESLGSDELIIEDYTGKNYIEIKTLLETDYGVNVIIEKKDYSGNYGEKEIIDQSVKKGSTLNKGDLIILYIPDQDLEYPDMVSEGWKEKDVLEFCAKHELSCTIVRVDDSTHSSGTIVYQSRSPKTKIESRSTLTVKVVE